MTTAPATRQGLMMFSLILATVVYTLDSTIAAIALPQMQGTFSATQEQVAWVLTSYIVASAIMTPMAGILTHRIGRRTLLLLCVGGFVCFSMACGLAVNLEEMVLFRILQGAFGAPLIPLAQAAVLDTYPPDQYGRGMALFGVGVMLGPILGPTLGGWLTEYFSWRWVFFINLPIGLIALVGIHLSVSDGVAEDRGRRFDFVGFIFLAIGIGALQLMLDRGNSLSWFQSTEIQFQALLAALCFYLFVAHILTAKRPFVDPHIFRDRNFSMSMLLSFVIGFNMMATMALMPPFLQSLLGYPVLMTGWILAPRGIGTMVSMMLVGRLVGRVDARILIIFGLLCSAGSLWLMSLFDHNVPMQDLVATGLLQGFGMGFMFVPMSSIAFATLPAQHRADGSGLYSLGRNVGSGIGISILMGALAVYIRTNREHLVTFINPFNPLLRDPAMPGIFDSHNLPGLEMLNQLVQREALMLAYLEDFRLMTILTLVAIPFVFMLRPNPRSK